jgi:phosphate transport system permease protein
MELLKFRHLKEKISSKVMLAMAGFVSALFIVIFLLLLSKSSLLLSKYSIIDLLFSSNWDPDRYNFGFYPVIVGTFYVTFISMMIAIPISLLSAIYISEYAPSTIRKHFSSFINILAGIPSVVFGICALLVFVPFVSDYLGPWFGIETTGMCIFTASLILAVMVFPIIISLSVESLMALPIELREASLSMGTTKWETIKHVLLKAAGPGIISSVLLGFGRAFGETIAVAMVVGGKNQVSSIFSAGQTMPSLIVSSFGEMMSVPMEQSALIFVALILFIVVTIFNILAKVIKRRIGERWKI